MKLGLHMISKPTTSTNGVTRLHAKEMVVVDLDTGEKVENLSGMLWGPGKIMTESFKPGDDLPFTKEHLDDDTDYLFLCIPCASAVEIS